MVVSGIKQNFHASYLQFHYPRAVNERDRGLMKSKGNNGGLGGRGSVTRTDIGGILIFLRLGAQMLG